METYFYMAICILVLLGIEFLKWVFSGLEEENKKAPRQRGN